MNKLLFLSAILLCTSAMAGKDKKHTLSLKFSAEEINAVKTKKSEKEKLTNITISKDNSDIASHIDKGSSLYDSLPQNVVASNPEDDSSDSGTDYELPDCCPSETGSLFDSDDEPITERNVLKAIEKGIQKGIEKVLDQMINSKGPSVSDIGRAPNLPGPQQQNVVAHKQGDSDNLCANCEPPDDPCQNEYDSIYGIISQLHQGMYELKQQALKVFPGESFDFLSLTQINDPNRENLEVHQTKKVKFNSQDESAD